MDLTGKYFCDGGIRGLTFGVVLIRDWIPVISGRRNELFLAVESRSLLFTWLVLVVIPKSLNI